jgi:hypothetical protein
MPKQKYGQKILHFFCRPCGEYHLKTHPHYCAAKRRAAKRLQIKQFTIPGQNPIQGQNQKSE